MNKLTKTLPNQDWDLTKITIFCAGHIEQIHTISLFQKKEAQHGWLFGAGLAAAKRKLKESGQKYTDWKRERGYNDTLVSRCQRIYRYKTFEELEGITITEAYNSITNSAKDECYTPPELIGKIRAVLEVIDLDPASSAEANKSVKAKKYFSKDTDGLKEVWQGKVFLNPPFSDESAWTKKLVAQILAGRVNEAIWIQSKNKFHDVLEKIPLVKVIPKDRPKFFNPIRGKHTSGHWETLLCYFGSNHGRFVTEFKSIAKTISIDSKYLKHGKRSKESQSLRDECYTSKELIKQIRSVLGEIDLDPASTFEANKTVRASKIYTKIENGLTKNWLGKLFLNPPFSEARMWINKLIVEAKSGRVTEAIFVLPKWSNIDALEKLPLLEFVPKIRPKFFNNFTKKFTTAPGGTVLYYYGQSPEKFKEVFSEKGVIRVDERLSKPRGFTENGFVKKKVKPNLHRPNHTEIATKENPGFQLKTADYAKDWRKAPANLQLPVSKDCFEKLPETLANCHKDLKGIFELCKDFGSKNLPNEDWFRATNKNIDSIIETCSDYQSVIANNNESDIQA